MLKRNKYFLNLYCISSFTRAVLGIALGTKFVLFTCWSRAMTPNQCACAVHVLWRNSMCMCCSRAMTSILCACAVHVLFMRYDVIVGIPLIAIWGGGGGNLLSLIQFFWVLSWTTYGKDWVVYQIEAIKKLYLVYKFQDFK